MKSMEPVHNTIVILRTLLLSAQEENLRLKSEIDSAKIQTIMYLSVVDLYRNSYLKMMMMLRSTLA